MGENKQVKIRILPSHKKDESVNAQDESKIIDIIKQKVLSKTKAEYYSVDVKVKRKADQTPEYLIAYMQRKDVYLAEVVRVDIKGDYKVTDSTWNYDSSLVDDDEEEESVSDKEGDYAGYDFVVSTPVDSIPSAKEAVQNLQNLLTNLGYNSKMLLGATATVANYKQYLTSGLKGFVNVGHGNTSGIALYDGFLNATWFNSVANKAVKPAVVYFNSCQVFNEPLKSAVMNAGARTFIGGIVNLAIGPSEQVCVCFWNKILKTAKLLGMNANLSQCEIDNYPTQGAHGIIGDIGRFIQLVTIKEVSMDPITIKEVRKDPITDPITIKEVRMDPITIKEVRMDPITIKEVGSDTIQPPIGGIRPQGSFRYVAPFITETPSRALSGQEDPIAQATAYVRELENALLQIEQQTAELLAAYEEAIATLEALNQGLV